MKGTTCFFTVRVTRKEVTFVKEIEHYLKKHYPKRIVIEAMLTKTEKKINMIVEQNIAQEIVVGSKIFVKGFLLSVNYYDEKIQKKVAENKTIDFRLPITFFVLKEMDKAQRETNTVTITGKIVSRPKNERGFYMVKVPNPDGSVLFIPAEGTKSEFSENKKIFHKSNLKMDVQVRNNIIINKDKEETRWYYRIAVLKQK